MGNYEWNEARLIEYRDFQIEESLVLEYKSADAFIGPDKKRKIAKAVSAMANSAGGIIIYGMAEYGDNERKHLPEKITPINRTQYSREWLSQVISSNISPPIEGLKIFPVKLNSTPNDVAYIVEIPKSLTAHQVIAKKDFRYFERLNFEAVPMMDHRIRDVMNRGVLPNAEVEFRADKYQDDGFTLLKVRVINCGRLAIHHIKLSFSFPGLESIQAINGPQSRAVGRMNVKETDADCLVKKEKYEYQITYYSDKVLFPEDEIDVLNTVSFKYRLIHPPEKKKRLEWKLYADSMMPKTGEIPILELNGR